MSDNQIQMVRIVGETDDGFVRINASDFDHKTHALFDDEDAGLVPAPKEDKVEVSSDITELRALISDLEDQVLEAQSEREEFKARAEAAEKELGDMKAEAAKTAGKGK